MTNVNVEPSYFWVFGSLLFSLDLSDLELPMEMCCIHKLDGNLTRPWPWPWPWPASSELFSVTFSPQPLIKPVPATRKRSSSWLHMYKASLQVLIDDFKHVCMTWLLTCRRADSSQVGNRGTEHGKEQKNKPLVRLKGEKNSTLYKRNRFLLLRSTVILRAAVVALASSINHSCRPSESLEQNVWPLLMLPPSPPLLRSSSPHEPHLTFQPQSAQMKSVLRT